jgi:transcriptional regulator with XRE-family HTH domain
MVDLKAWRQSAGITQAKAADRLAITLRHYQKLEAGHAPINRRMLLLAGIVIATGDNTD